MYSIKYPLYDFSVSFPQGCLNARNLLAAVDQDSRRILAGHMDSILAKYHKRRAPSIPAPVILALRLFGAENGWFFREEANLGSIEPGKFGDLIALREDYFDPQRVPD